MRKNFRIRSKKDIINAVNDFGFLPFFENSIEGFSIEEHIAPNLWFTGIEGPWEWKGPIIREAGFAYGKFFDKKACFACPEWFKELANYRRDGYDFDSRFDDGLASYRDKELFDLIDSNAPIISKELKKIGDYGKNGKKGFDTIISRLQSQCYVLISDFVYMTDRYGQPYGWGVAEYSTPELFFGKDFSDNVYSSEPEESFEKLMDHFSSEFPNITADAVRKFLK